MTYNNCKFPCNLNNFSRPFHCLLFGECKKWIWGPVLLFVVAYPSDMRLPTTFLNTNLQLFNSNVIILGQHTISMPFEHCRKITPFQMHNVTYCKVSTMWVSVGGFDVSWPQRMNLMMELDLVWLIKYSVSCWVYLGQAQPLKQLSYLRHQSKTIRSQVSVLSSCHFPLTESRGTVFYLTSIKTWALTSCPTPLPAPQRPFSLPPQRLRRKIGREENQNG